jgi:hypothetical protein
LNNVNPPTGVTPLFGAAMVRLIIPKLVTVTAKTKECMCMVDDS